MKRIALIAIGLLASLAAAATASAQDHAVKATVPFGFYVGNAWVPAGTYVLGTRVGSGSFLSVRDRSSKIDIVSMVEPDGERAHANVLIFKRYGDQYFLHQIHSSSTGMSLALPTTKRETRAAERQTASVAPPTAVYLALR